MEEGIVVEFSKIQDRFINQKSVGFQLLKGKKDTGKSTSAIYRTINLENNYCIYEEDRILFITSNYGKARAALELYQKENNKNHFYSLFSLDKERVNISTLEKLISTYSLAYMRGKRLSLSNINSDMNLNIGFEILDSLEDAIKQYSKKSKLIKNAKREFILDEIMWIKASTFRKEEYLKVERKGRKGRVLRNSLTREYLYELSVLYTSELNSKGYMDKYDHVLFAKTYLENNNVTNTHIVIDDVEKLTRGEIELVKALYSNKKHSSIIFIVNSELENEKYAWLVKGRRLKTLGADFKGRTFSFKSTIKKEKPVILDTISRYSYVNLKNKGLVKFNIDTASINSELYLEDGIVYANDELVDIPVFNEIAAGNPIEIIEEIEDKFQIPIMWLGVKDGTFILKVKGDSMVEKNICDGDLVVIKKQDTANHNDIVAVNLDGEATLKTLNLNSEKPLLMPANSLYNPITLEGKNASILGIAVGIIKKR